MVGKGMFELSGKVALVCAGGHGLGREYCAAMAEYGADVACADINIDGAPGNSRNHQEIWEPCHSY